MMTEEEIKVRRLVNQYLIEPSEKMTVVRNLCGIQAQFMPNDVHSLKIRCSDFDGSTLKNGLVKNWTIRGTVHVFAEEDLPLFLHCNNGRNYRRNEWNDTSFWNQRDSWALTPERQKYFSDVILSSLEKEPLTREELRQICRDHGMTPLEEDSMFHPWGGGIRELCERGFMNYVVQEKKAFGLSPEFTPIPEENAKLEMARRYFTNFGPATIRDAMYFFHASALQVKKWLSELPVTACEWEGKTFYYIPNGKSYDPDIPECLFLAGFDQLMLGYEKKESLFFKSEYMRSIFNLSGIVIPAVMLRGNVVGRWKKKNRTLTTELFESVSESDAAVIRRKAESLWDDIGRIDWK